MGARSGRQYIERLKAHPREVWVRGKRITDVTTYPGFAGVVEQVARIYDLQHDPRYRDILTYESPTSGERVARSFQPIASHEDLKRLGRAFATVANETFGLLGRSPDYKNGFIAGLAECSDFFIREGGKHGQRYRERLLRYYEYARENDLCLTHAIVSPQNDRSKTFSELEDPDLHLRVVRETEDGLIVRGARMLATLGPIADEVVIFNFQPIKPDEGAYAPFFTIPLDTPGIRQMCRDPFTEGPGRSFDHPLSSRFEEPDSLLIFDDVLIPWERVFLHDNPAAMNAIIRGTSASSRMSYQAQSRGLAKVRLAAGLISAVTEATGTTGFLHVAQMIGESLQYVEVVRGLIVAAEERPKEFQPGVIVADSAPLLAIRTLLPVYYPRLIEILQTVGAGGLLMMPTGEDLASPIGALVARYYVGKDIDAVDRVRLFKIAWDLVGHAFGSRATQYERYYSGDNVRNMATLAKAIDQTENRRMVQAAVDLAGDPIAEPQPVLAGEAAIH